MGKKLRSKMTLEDIAFNLLLKYLNENENFDIISAHPPSGKSYFTDLIRIPNPIQKSSSSKRDHIDVIFCSKSNLYLCELKGVADESEDDINKLRVLIDYYSLDDIRRIINSRLSFECNKINQFQKIIIAIGATKGPTTIEKDVLYLIVSENSNLQLLGYKPDFIKNDFNF